MRIMRYKAYLLPARTGARECKLEGSIPQFYGWRFGLRHQWFSVMSF
jgi:hypothetical protein